MIRLGVLLSPLLLRREKTQKNSLNQSERKFESSRDGIIEFKFELNLKFKLKFKLRLKLKLNSYSNSIQI